MKKSYLCLFLALAIATPTWAVVNGTKVIKKSVGLGGPEDYVVELNIEKKDSTPGGGNSITSYCTGVFIAPTIILTAGHCATAKPRAKFNGKALEVQSVQLLSGFNKKNVYDTNSLNNDLAILRLKKAPQAGFKVARIPDHNEELRSGLQLNVIGYGRTGLDSRTVLKDDMGTLRKGLNASYKTVNNDILINQATGSAGLCEGDSGSPLLEENTQGYTVWGIASTVRPPKMTKKQLEDDDLMRKDTRKFLEKHSGIDLCKGTGIYTDLRSELDWIKSVLAEL